MKIALVNVKNENKKGAMNKDLAGGMGTFSSFGNSIPSKLISLIKKRAIKLPIISFAFLQAIFKERGHDVDYIETNRITKEYDLILLYGSIVDYKFENKICASIKKRNPNSKVGFFGSFPSIRPEIFSKSDFVIKGEVESFFLYQFDNLENLKGIIKVKKTLNLDDLPTPDFDNFPIKNYSYFPAIKEKPFLVLQASRGCPYPCHFYCPYGMIQGQKYRIRSAEKIIQDIKVLIQKYKIKGIQFRDPTFGINKEQVIEMCRLIIHNKIKIKFGIETRLDILDKKILKLLFKAGLRNLNIGIETIDKEISKLNKRILMQKKHQEDILNYCKQIGVKVSAFYIFGMIKDTKKSIKKNIDYAISLNTNIAQFCISCPYPGTKYYKDLKSKNLISEDNFENFNSVNLVFKHDNLNDKQIKDLIDCAITKYYFRLGYIIEFIKWRIREFWL